MKEIPLHSLVILVGPGYDDEAIKSFSDYEIVDPEQVKTSLVGSFGPDITKELAKEITHRIRTKIHLGERVVVAGENIRTRDRFSIAQLGNNLGVPVFYIIKNNGVYPSPGSEDEFKNNEKNILKGDGVAEVVDSRVTDYKVVRKLPYSLLYHTLKLNGFKGLTVVPDVHGMRESLKNALMWAASRQHFIVFLGDILDYGPRPLECVADVYDVVMRGRGALVLGNHERKIDKWLDQDRTGKEISVRISDGNKVTIDAIKKLNKSTREQFEIKFKALMRSARNHYVIGNILFTHGAAVPEMFKSEEHRLDKEFADLAMFGQIDQNDKIKENGYPNRIYDWVDLIPKDHIVVVGHDIRDNVKPYTVSGKTGGTAVFLDTGCGKGGVLSTMDIRFGKELLAVHNFNQH